MHILHSRVTLNKGSMADNPIEKITRNTKICFNEKKVKKRDSTNSKEITM